MLLSVALILLCGMSFGWICKRMRMPALVGMLGAGILLGPYGLGMLDESLLHVSPQIRKIALVIILTRAGLGLDLSALKKIGRPAVLMCFLPATAELIGVLLLGPKLLGLTLGEAAILGAVLAAVSPAVVVPRMVNLMENRLGTAQGIPQLILAGASVDDVYVIVLFSTFLGMGQGEGVELLPFLNIPFSIAAGIGLGLLAGFLLGKLYERCKSDGMVQVLVLLSVSLLLCAAEDALSTKLTFSALIAIMLMGVALRRRAPMEAQQISVCYKKIWVGAEVFLFVLVGAAVNISCLKHVGAAALLLIPAVMVFRMLGVFLCLVGSPMNGKERLFTMLAYTPKATVQAAIGGVPLALGMSCGDTVLTVAVLAILITAPLGAFAIDIGCNRLLRKEEAPLERNSSGT